MELLIAPNSVPLSGADVVPTSGTPQYATDGNPATGVPATQAPASHYNMMMAELVAFVTAAGIQPSGSDWGQLLKAARTLFAPIVSPAFQGLPHTPTPPPGDSSPQIANTFWVRTEAFSRTFGPAVPSGFYSGYRIAPDGMITQWVFVDKATLPAGVTGYAVEFPIVFPTVAISAQATSVNSTSSNNGVSVNGLVQSGVQVVLNGNYSVIVRADGY